MRDKIRVATVNQAHQLVILTLKIESKDNLFGVKYMGNFYKLEPNKVLLWKGRPLLLLIPPLAEVVTTAVLFHIGKENDQPE